MLIKGQISSTTVMMLGSLLMGIAFFITGCVESTPRERGTLIAEIGTDRLYLEQVKASTPSALFEQDSVAVIEQFRKRWVQRRILANEARRMGLDNQEYVRKQLDNAMNEVLANALISQLIREVDREPIARHEAQAYYENHKQQFVLNERHVRFRHIRSNTVQEAVDAKEALMRGRPWEEVANTYDVNPNEVIRNANLFFPISIALYDNSLMNTYLRQMGITEISPIRRHDGQLHFVQLIEDRAEGDHPEIDWVLDQIEEWLKLDRKQKRISAFERNLILQAEANNELRVYNVVPY